MRGNKISDFVKGIIVGVVCSVIVFGIIAAFYFLNLRDKGLIEYAEKQIEIETLREDYSSRDPVEYLDDIPDVRRAASGAAAEFERKRDEAIQRFRSGLVN